MKVGLDSYSFRYAAGLWGWDAGGRLTPSGYLRLARGLGLEGVHFADLGHFESLDEDYLAGVRREAEAAGLYLELGTGGTDPGHLANALHAAVALGARALRTFAGGFRWENGPHGAELIEQAVANLRQVVPLAEELGVRIAVENHLDLRAAEMAELVHRVGSDWLGVCLDTGNPFALLEDPIETAEVLAPCVFTTHLKEFRLTLRPEGLVVRGVPLGEGDVPNAAILPILRERGPLGDELALNLETAIERVAVPIFRDDFAELLGGLEGAEVLGFISRLDLADPWSAERLALPDELGLSPDDILAAERTQMAASAAWALRQVRSG